MLGKLFYVGLFVLSLDLRPEEMERRAAMLAWGRWRWVRRQLPAAVLTVLQTLQSHGYSAYLVGGAPRDLLLGRRPQD